MFRSSTGLHGSISRRCAHPCFSSEPSSQAFSKGDPKIHLIWNVEGISTRAGCVSPTAPSRPKSISNRRRFIRRRLFWPLPDGWRPAPRRRSPWHQSQRSAAVSSSPAGLDPFARGAVGEVLALPERGAGLEVVHQELAASKAAPRCAEAVSDEDDAPRAPLGRSGGSPRRPVIGQRAAPPRPRAATPPRPCRDNARVRARRAVRLRRGRGP